MQASLVYDSSGDVVDELYGTQNRLVVPSEEIKRTLQDGVVAIEDHRFYEYQALDSEGIAHAALENMRSPSFKEGGSITTPQLIKNTYKRG